MARERKPIEGTYPQGSRASFLGNGSTEVPRKKRSAKAPQARSRTRVRCAASRDVWSQIEQIEVAGTGLGPATGNGSAFGCGKARDCRELARLAG